MNKTLRAFIGTLLCAALVLCCFSSAFAAGEPIEISSPYDGVDWNTVGQYKTALHTHTNASDGHNTMREMLEREYETGFEIVASTDHGTVSYSWADENVNPLIYKGLRLLGRSEGELDYLGSSGTFSNGVGYTVSVDSSGDEVLTAEDGRTMLRVPFGIEQNALSVNAHMCSWFADFYQDKLTTYEDAARGVSKAGGICVINHPGEYTKAKEEIETAFAYDETDPSYRYYINKYASLLDRYGCVIGIDMNSKGDSRTRFDRKLWDILLKRFSANGKNVFGIASSDAHNLGVVDTGCVYLIMPEKNNNEVRSALENGRFFAASTCIGNYDELLAISSALKELYGTSDLTSKIDSVTERMAERIDLIKSDRSMADENLGIELSFLDGQGYCASDTRPAVTSIETVDGKITVNTEDALLIRWISDGKQIAYGGLDDGTETIDLSDFSDDIGDYVRAEIFGDGGVVYTEAFLINASSKDGNKPVTDGLYIDLGFLDCLLAIFNNWADILKRMIAL